MPASLAALRGPSPVRSRSRYRSTPSLPSGLLNGTGRSAAGTRLSPKTSHSASGTAIHGRAWELPDRGGGGLARVHGLAVGGRDKADPEGRRRDARSATVSGG